jgi:RHS repeat-associated protein
LVKITQASTGNPTLTSEFTYDGFSRWVKIVEKSNSNVTSTKQFVWCGTKVREERDANNVVTKRFFGEGEQIVATSLKFYFTRDHLGSIREMTGNQGITRAQYDYDPYGRRTKITGDQEADFGFTGHYYHAPSGLHLAVYRAYDADIGRWINRDPIRERGGLNLYEYVLDQPTGKIDRLGLSSGHENDAPITISGRSCNCPANGPTPLDVTYEGGGFHPSMESAICLEWAAALVLPLGIAFKVLGRIWLASGAAVAADSAAEAETFMLAMQEARAEATATVAEAQAEYAAETAGTEAYYEAGQELVAADQGLAQAELNLAAAIAEYQAAAARAAAAAARAANSGF